MTHKKDFLSASKIIIQNLDNDTLRNIYIDFYYNIKTEKSLERLKTREIIEELINNEKHLLVESNFWRRKLNVNNLFVDEILKRLEKNDYSKKDFKRALILAGKLANLAMLVTTANAKNLSQKIKKMEIALYAYNNYILSLSKDR